MLLRIGNVVVNVDQVREIYVSPGGEAAQIRFGLDRQIGVRDEEAKALSRWLDANAINLTPKTAAAKGYEE